MTEPVPDLVARVAGVAEVGEPPALVASVAEEADGSGFRLEFQRASVFDQQDRQLGMDTYCISTGEGATYYGGVEGLHVDADGVTIKLDPLAAGRLHLPNHFRMSLHVPPEDKAKFVVGLRRVLGMARQ